MRLKQPLQIQIFPNGKIFDAAIQRQIPAEQKYNRSDGSRYCHINYENDKWYRCTYFRRNRKRSEQEHSSGFAYTNAGKADWEQNNRHNNADDGAGLHQRKTKLGQEKMVLQTDNPKGAGSKNDLDI